MAGEKNRGAPKKQAKKPSAASKAKEAKKIAARDGNRTASGLPPQP